MKNNKYFGIIPIYNNSSFSILGELHNMFVHHHIASDDVSVLQMTSKHATDKRFTVYGFTQGYHIEFISHSGKPQ